MLGLIKIRPNWPGHLTWINIYIYIIFLCIFYFVLNRSLRCKLMYWWELVWFRFTNISCSFLSMLLWENHVVSYCQFFERRLELEFLSLVPEFPMRAWSSNKTESSMICPMSWIQPAIILTRIIFSLHFRGIKWSSAHFA